MTTHVAFLRAINLGATNKVAMADLRDLLGELGYDRPRTFLQSGNAVFGADGRTGAELEVELAAALAERFGFDIPVMVRSHDELAEVVAGNPFPGRSGVDIKQLHAAFLDADPTPAKVKGLDVERYAPDECAFGDRVMYLRLPGGVQGSKLPAATEKALEVRATMRTWNTVTRLLALAADE